MVTVVLVVVFIMFQSGHKRNAFGEGVSAWVCFDTFWIPAHMFTWITLKPALSSQRSIGLERF